MTVEGKSLKARQKRNTRESDLVLFRMTKIIAPRLMVTCQFPAKRMLVKSISLYADKIMTDENKISELF